MQPFIAPHEIELANIAVFSLFGITLESICPKNRKREAAIYRQAVQAALLRYTTLSEYSIGYFTGMRNHASVIHSDSVITKQEKLFAKYGIANDQLKIYNTFCKCFVELLSRTQEVTRNQRQNRSILLKSVGHDNFGVKVIDYLPACDFR